MTQRRMQPNINALIRDPIYPGLKVTSIYDINLEFFRKQTAAAAAESYHGGCCCPCRCLPTSQLRCDSVYVLHRYRTTPASGTTHRSGASPRACFSGRTTTPRAATRTTRHRRPTPQKPRWPCAWRSTCCCRCSPSIVCFNKDGKVLIAYNLWLGDGLHSAVSRLC